jgi:hypothetical protein
LKCNNNLLTELPKLSNSLEYLKCYDNHIRSIPKLPFSIITLYCTNNNLILLPTLPSTITELYSENNSLIYKEITLKCINETNNKIEKFKYLFYCLKYKKMFRKWLWENVREKKIINNMHPNIIANLLKDKDINEIDFTLFDTILEN